MRKTALAILAMLILFGSFLSCLPFTVSAESLYIRKIVSVVYDDSGSMKGDKWAYANYAMQTFCGMLNSEDRLFITYMSHSQLIKNYDPKRIDLSADKIRDSVNSIRTHTDSGSTPYAAVETAYKKLKSENDSNPNTQYWLVVITDGEFDECNSMSNDNKKRFLNEKFKDYAASEMPNGTKPRVTFLGIGDVASPDENQSKGIFTYSASNAGAIIDAMSDMADRISGRTRLQNSAFKKLDDQTIQVSSSIPLLNIAVFVQGSQAGVAKAVYSNESDILISRNVSLQYPGYPDLVGGAFLLGDSKAVIGSGTYSITFDRSVDLNDIIILFEPALEMRMAVTVNGKQISAYSELNKVMEKDKVSVLCKIYEMGTDTVVDPALLPPGTKFQILVLEDGKIAEQKTGKDMALSDYVLKNVDTEIAASVIIEGFNPIAYSAEFTPDKYVPKVVYSMTAAYGSGVKSVKADNIAANKDLSICFTVFANGEAITDPNKVKALHPTIRVLPKGNDGAVSYSTDGRIVFTPNAASVTASSTDSFDVDVACALSDGTTAQATYTVLISECRVIPIGTGDTIKKTGFFGNQVAAAFYITKDGVKLDRNAVGNRITVSLDEKHSELKTSVDVANDGTITVLPYAEEEHKLTFWNWWTNWAYYFGLEGADVVVTLDHAYGTAVSVIDVVDANAAYLILNVYLPLFVEILLLAAIIAYIIRYFTKARFAPNGVLYVGSIDRNRGTPGTHRLFLSEIQLKQYNKFKNLWNPFKELTVSAGGVNITAAKGNRILCNESFPWYSDGVRPKDRTFRMDSPKDIVNYCQDHDELIIQEIKTVSVMDEQNRMIMQDDSVYYFLRAETMYVKVGTGQTEVIDNAVAVCYSTIQN